MTHGIAIPIGSIMRLIGAAMASSVNKDSSEEFIKGTTTCGQQLAHILLDIATKANTDNEGIVNEEVSLLRDTVAEIDECLRKMNE